jgi:endonuclease YncB( thermonuclease family)
MQRYPKNFRKAYLVPLNRPDTHYLMNQAAICASDPLGQNGRNMHHNKTSSLASANFIWMMRVLVLLLSLSFINCAVAAKLMGKVIGVLDGDTIDVLDANKVTHRIRLTGIDAPEKAQAYGQRSKEHLSDTVFGKQVEVQAGKSDKYGRTVGKVLVSGVDANLEQVKDGLAWHYKQYASEQSVSDRELYSNAEDIARNSRSGLWRDPKPMPPWEWRHGGKDLPTTSSIASGCSCSSAEKCTGPKGGHFCVNSNGKKRYQ